MKENTLLSVYTSIIDIHITHVHWSVGGLSDHYLLHMTNINKKYLLVLTAFIPMWKVAKSQAC